MKDDVLFFADQPTWRRWLEKNHAKAQELWVGYYKKDSGKPSITWPQSVDEALCFGWIDGIRKGIDETRYKIRFTPRKLKSIWSRVNIKRAGELIELGLMMPTGLKAFEARHETRSVIYSYEQRSAPTFDPAHEEQFKANKKAWAWFQSRPPGYRKIATWWVISAKREETRLRRLKALIEDSARELTIQPMTPPKKRKK